MAGGDNYSEQSTPRSGSPVVGQNFSSSVDAIPITLTTTPPKQQASPKAQKYTLDDRTNSIG